jgi:hypothetical protein
MSLPKNCIQDSNIDYKRKWRTWWAKDLVNFATSSSVASGGFSTLTSGFNPTAFGSLMQMGSTHHQAIRFASIGSGASALAPSIDFNMDVEDIDNGHPIYFRCEFTTDAATAAALTPQWYYSTLTDGNAANRPATAVTVAAASTAKATTAQALKMTTSGYLAPLATGGFANETLHPATTGLSIKLCFSTLTNAAVATDFLYITRVMVGYTPSMTFGQGSGRQARRMKAPLLTMEQDPSTNN